MINRYRLLIFILGHIDLKLIPFPAFGCMLFKDVDSLPGMAVLCLNLLPVDAQLTQQMGTRSFPQINTADGAGRFLVLPSQRERFRLHS